MGDYCLEDLGAQYTRFCGRWQEHTRTAHETGWGGGERGSGGGDAMNDTAAPEEEAPILRRSKCIMQK